MSVAKPSKFKSLGSIKCLTFLVTLCLVSLMVTALVLRFSDSGTIAYTIYIDTQGDPIYTVNDKFISLGLDSSILTEGFKNFNMSDPVLIKMIGILSPAYLRIGGNQADQIIFSEEILENNANNSHNFILTGHDWSRLYNLSLNCNISIIFDLNSLLRYDNGSWNSKNAEEMIRFSEKHNFILDWELGNEPNSYEHKFDTYVNATQLGIDYIALRDILNKTELYKNSYLVGPSTTRLRTTEIEDYFRDFLVAGEQAVSAITWHHYYFGGVNATPEQFLDPDIFDYLKCHIIKVKNIINELDIKYKPTWLGETSSAWHGGAPDLSDRFIGSFIWMDKLGLSSKMGVDLLVRQSIFGGNYSLIDDNYYPNPDWWLSVLYNTFVGPQVVDTKTDGDARIRLYAHCAKRNILWLESNSVVVIFGVNLSDKEGTVSIEELKSEELMYVYQLTAADTLYSQEVHLNGEPLLLLPNTTLPVFEPKIMPKEKEVTIAPYSITFWILPNSNVKACQDV